MEIKEIIGKFDKHLFRASLEFEGVVVGGSSMVLLGIVSRQTQDLDLLNDKIAAQIEHEAREFAKVEGLALDWFNNAPASLKKDLPNGWELRLQQVFFGKAIQLHALGRGDLIKTKLWALCDRARDLPDVLALKPTREELKDALEWLNPLDLNPNWISHVESTIEFVSKKLGYTNEK